MLIIIECMVSDLEFVGGFYVRKIKRLQTELAISYQLSAIRAVMLSFFEEEWSKRTAGIQKVIGYQLSGMG